MATYNVYREGRLVQTLDQLSTKAASSYVGARVVSPSDGTIYETDGTTWYRQTNKIGGAAVAYALATVNEAGSNITSGAGRNALVGSGLVYAEVRVSRNVAMATSDLIVVGWSEVASSISDVNTEIEAAIDEFKAAPAARTGATLDGVYVFENVEDKLIIEASPGQTIETLVAKSYDASGTAIFSVNVIGNLEPA